MGILAGPLHLLVATTCLAGSNPPPCSLQGAHHQLLLQRTLENLTVGARVRLSLHTQETVEGYYYPGFLPDTLMVSRFPRTEDGADTILERMIPLDSISSIQSLPRQGPEQEGRTGRLPPPQTEASGANPAFPRIPRPAGIPTDLLESLSQTSLESPPEPPRIPPREVVVPLAARSRYARRYPPLGRKDTIMILPGESARSIHESSFAPFIQDSEILHIYPLQPAQIRGLAYGSSEGLAVIQQQGVRGCTAASAEMLIHDRLGPGAVSVDHLKTTNLGNSARIADRISAAGLRPLVTTLHSGNRRVFLEQLAAALTQQGPGSMGIDGEIGIHNIVLDSLDLTNNRATLRDPWHGWRITISIDSLYQRLGSGEQTLVQITTARD